MPSAEEYKAMLIKNIQSSQFQLDQIEEQDVKRNYHHCKWSSAIYDYEVNEERHGLFMVAKHKHIEGRGILDRVSYCPNCAYGRSCK